MKSKIIIFLILISSIILGNFHFNKNNISLPEINKIFPHKINKLTSIDYKASQDVYDMIPADKMLLRIYRNSITKDEISLAIVLTDKREHIHDPDICYHEQGFSFGKKEISNLSTGRQIVYIPALKDNKKFDIFYWYTDLNATYPYKADFLKHAAYARFFDKPFKGYGLVIVISSHENYTETAKFNKIIDTILTKIEL